jgi:hypothetical protein
VCDHARFESPVDETHETFAAILGMASDHVKRGETVVSKLTVLEYQL